MPRRNDNARKNQRRKRRGGAYRPDAAPALARIEAKRKRLSVTVVALAARAGIGERTLRRMLRDGRAFPRHVRALQFCLRSIEREQLTENEVLP